MHDYLGLIKARTVSIQYQFSISEYQVEYQARQKCTHKT